MTDRTTKTLLILIAIGLWGSLLRPLFAPASVQAQQAGPPAAGHTSPHISGPPAIAVDKDWIYVAADGYITQFQRDGDGEMTQAGRAFPYPGKLAVSR